TYSLRMASTVYMDKAESVEELREELKNKIKSEPKVEVSTNYTNYDKIKENSKVRLVHKPMNFNTDLEVVGLKKKHPMTNEKADVEFTNNTTDILRIQRQFNKAISNMNKGD
ncbi:MAG: phage tail protein, partial [Staphylococcus equorum]|nr:phage tail protein [Staphylococcus equorum]